MVCQYNRFKAAIAAPAALLLILAALGASATSLSLTDDGNGAVPSMVIQAGSETFHDDSVELPEQPTSRRHLRAAGSQAVKPKPKLEVVKTTFKSKGDFLNLSADKSDDSGFSFLYIGAFNKATKSSNPADAPLDNYIIFSYYTCQRSPGASQCPGDFNYDCTDIYGNATITALQFSLDSKLNSVVSASFTGSKLVPGSTTPEPVDISILLHIACNPANIIKSSTACGFSTQSFGSPALRSRSEFKADTTSCAIDRASVSGSIEVNFTPSSGSTPLYLMDFLQNTADYASVQTGKSKDSSFSFDKNGVV